MAEPLEAAMGIRQPAGDGGRTAPGSTPPSSLRAAPANAWEGVPLDLLAALAKDAGYDEGRDNS